MQLDKDESVKQRLKQRPASRIRDVSDLPSMIKRAAIPFCRFLVWWKSRCFENIWFKNSPGGHVENQHPDPYKG